MFETSWRVYSRNLKIKSRPNLKMIRFVQYVRTLYSSFDFVKLPSIPSYFYHLFFNRPKTLEIYLIFSTHKFLSGLIQRSLTKFEKWMGRNILFSPSLESGEFAQFQLSSIRWTAIKWTCAREDTCRGCCARRSITTLHVPGFFLCGQPWTGYVLSSRILHLCTRDV